MSYMSNRYKERREKVLNFLGNKCVICENTENLEVDHINNLEKSFDVTRAFSYKWSTIELELKKCQLLCKSCHLEKTRKEPKYNKADDDYIFVHPMPARKVKEIPHGTVSGYNYHMCRCSECKNWNRLRQKSKKALPV